MKKVSVLLGLGCFCFSFGPLLASSLRLDSTGSLSLVLTDETCDINAYTLGNPAGMALLSPTTRLDLSIPWYSTTTAGGSTHWSALGISPASSPGFLDFSNTVSSVNSTAGFQYQGLLYVPRDQWAFQAGGGLWGSSDQLAPSPQATGIQSGLGLFRTAVDLGGLAAGTEFQVTQSDSTTPGSNPVTVDQSSGIWNTGVLANIPLDGKKSTQWLRTGASFSFSPLPRQTNYYFSTNSNTQHWHTIQNTSGVIFEPSFFLDIAGSFQGGIILDVNHSSETESVVINNFESQPSFTYGAGDGFNFAALYKWKPALTGPDEIHPLTFNNGIFIGTTNFNGIFYNPAGSTIETYQDDGLDIQIGIGLEREGDFTVGIQTVGLSQEGNVQYSTGPNFEFYDFSTYRFTLGGEKWLSPHWALCLGLTWIDDQNPEPIGGNYAGEGFFILSPGQQVQGLLTTVGAGYQDSRLRVDGILWFEAPQSTGAGFTGPDYAYTVVGAGISGTLFFGN